MDKNKMLIDATHPEETRVVAVRNGRVEEFDFESAARKLLRGNIYLAKVTRVEPSLQAAFIDYGGNRHGFLAFSEIHPDYYQIPVADRELLKQEEAEAEQRAEAELEERSRSRGPRRRRRNRGDRSSHAQTDQNGGSRSRGRRDDQDNDQPSDIETFEDGYRTSGPSNDDDRDSPAGSSTQAYRHAASPDDVRRAEPETTPDEAIEVTYTSADVSMPAPDNDTAPGAAEPASRDDEAPTADAAPNGPKAPPIAYPRGSSRPIVAIEVDPYSETGLETARIIEIDDVDDIDEGDDDTDDQGAAAEDEAVEQVTDDEDVLEEVPERPRRRARQYKIQEVTKRRQILLVQVVKEERGNKGAALTTYISLAGRYTVLMPNTARGGGISRKITQPQDRKRLKAIAEELDVPEGMGLIIRTAGATRTKQEIKRDYEYLLRLWESVRELTLSSTAPSLVYEEGNIIKRAIRDLYSKDFDQIVVAGDGAHRDAQDFMEMLMPGSGNHVVNYRAAEPLFARYGVERQLNALFSPYVTLRSGGYIVINQTEALVSVDVNSGKSTREFSIEETALNTNLEAAEEISRQLKLRDLAGLIVIDFIDMEEKRNNRAVERRLKDALRHDRARIQVGRISHFGLMEMSRQRLRAGVLEGSTSQCPHCQGTGIIRSIESVALAVLRGLEDQLLKQPSSLIATTTAEVALYILNHKRAYITEMERRHGVVIRVEASDRMQGANFGVERIATPAAVKPVARPAVSMEWGFDRDEDAEADDQAEEASADEDREASDTQRARGEGSDDERRGRRRRRRRGRRDREGDGNEADNRHETGSDQQHREAHGSQDDASASQSAGDDPAAFEDADEAGDSPRAAGEGNAEETGGEPRRRGRRRGRRGGRSRRREGEAQTAGAGGEGDTDSHEWHIAELAGPGSERSTGTPSEASADMHLVHSVEVEAGSVRKSHGLRATIVESIDATSAYAHSSSEALRLAVVLAGGTPDQPEAPAAAPAPEARQEAVATETVSAPPESVERAPTVESPAPAPSADMVAETTPEIAHEHVPENVPAASSGAETPVVEPSREVVSATEVSTSTEVVSEAAPETEDAPQPAAPPNGRYPAQTTIPETTSAAAEEQHAAVATRETEPDRPARKGWWQRRFGSPE